MSVRFLFLAAAEIGPYVGGLRAIERATEYPIADGADRFTIDHGDDYARFFTMLGHEARFVLALDGERVVGGLAGIARNVRVRGRMLPALYGADWKLAPDWRGRGLGRQMMTWALGIIPRERERLTWRYGYVAAMRGAKGDVMRATRGLHAARLTRRSATLAVYFVPVTKLARLSLVGSPRTPDLDAGIDLSFVPSGHVEAPGVVSTAGRKDLRLRSTGEPWPLVHLPYGPSRWTPTLGHYLRACGEALTTTRPEAIACFAVDERLVSHLSWLQNQGLTRGAGCTVYALDLTLRARSARWLHLATSEI